MCLHEPGARVVNLTGHVIRGDGGWTRESDDASRSREGEPPSGFRGVRTWSRQAHTRAGLSLQVSPEGWQTWSLRVEGEGPGPTEWSCWVSAWTSTADPERVRVRVPQSIEREPGSPKWIHKGEDLDFQSRPREVQPWVPWWTQSILLHQSCRVPLSAQVMSTSRCV